MKAAGLADWRQHTLDRMRRLIQEADPAMVEERKWAKASNPSGVPVWAHGGIVCTGEVCKAAVKLTFAKGAALPDPAKVFNASLEGNTRRAIDIHEGETVNATAFKALVRAAVALNTAGDQSKTQARKNIARNVTGKGEVSPDTRAYNQKLQTRDKAVCDLLAGEISTRLPEAENKIWHAHPVWFLDGNPIVGYSIQKPGVRLMFWSGADFGEADLSVAGGKFKDASIFYNGAAEVEKSGLRRWLKKAREIQWDYKNIVRRKGRLEKLR